MPWKDVSIRLWFQKMQTMGPCGKKSGGLASKGDRRGAVVAEGKENTIRANIRVIQA